MLAPPQFSAMEPYLFLPSPKPSCFPPSPPSSSSSNKFPFLAKSNLSSKPHCSLSPPYLQKSHFYGKGLVLSQKNVDLVNLRNFHGPIFHIRAAAAAVKREKRRKESSFDNVIQRDKKINFILKMRKILLRQPDRTLSLNDLDRYRKQLGLHRSGHRKFVASLKRFPAVFQVMDEGVYSLKFRMTPRAEKLFLEELRIKSKMEGLLVVRLRKLLMMSLDKRILLKKITHLRSDLGLPRDFDETICHAYPQYFKVVAMVRGPALELTHWDPELAVSAAELSGEGNRIDEENDLLVDVPQKFKRVKLPKGLKLSKAEMKRIMQFRDMPYISPYLDFSSIRLGTREKEKHACGVVHEILSLTVEKRSAVDNLAQFREDFRFSDQLRGMLIRHPDMFYVSLKGERDCVFLREAYHGSELKEKDPLLTIKEKLRSMIAVPRQKGDDRRDGDGLEEDGEWSDAYNFMSDDRFEDYGKDDHDDWNDEDDDSPPNFFDDVETLEIGKDVPTLQVEDSKKNDGHPREQW
ncbi:hypothetical protein RIF29_16459 [Crotalaria pallida]|uniref:PORR domain-containing protein n=1 Tax=Crotalaria pallida TaxID=3830 RepID=A0AAN9FHC0_CROPI